MIRQAERFLEYQQSRKLSPRTLAVYERFLRNMLAHLTEISKARDIRDISRRDMDEIAAWVHELKDTRSGLPLAPSTKAAYIRVIKQYFAWLMKENELLINPASHLEMPGKTRLRPQSVLTVEEVHCLLDAAESWTSSGLRDRAVMEVMYSTAMRKQELLHLTLMDIDLATGHVRIRRGKGSRERVVPLGIKACHALERYVLMARPLLVKNRRENALFLSRDGAPLKGFTLSQMLRRRSAMAGTRYVTPHMLRRACATHLCQAGMSLPAIQQLLGHSDLETTRGYLRMSTYEAKRTHSALHPREHMKLKKLEIPQDKFQTNRPENGEALCRS